MAAQNVTALLQCIWQALHWLLVNASALLIFCCDACRFDLFHGHLFIANICSASEQQSSKPTTATRQDNNTSTRPTSAGKQYSSSEHRSRTTQLHQQQHQQHHRSSRCRVGVLFHASEYPAYDESTFPINLGHCQAGSSCRYNPRAMDLRNIIWWQVRELHHHWL
jgi:hypothetical protein